MAKSIKLQNDTYLSTLSVLKIFYQYKLSGSFTKTKNDYEIIPFDVMMRGSKGGRHALTRNNGSFTINDAGMYRITLSGYINPRESDGQRALAIYKNGSSEIEIIRADILVGYRTPVSFVFISSYENGDVFDIRFRGKIGDDFWSNSVLIIEQIE